MSTPVDEYGTEESGPADSLVSTPREPPEVRWAPGRTVGKYTILRTLGAGTFGLALLARREGRLPTSRFEKIVCLKVLKPIADYAMRAEFSIRMLDEAKLQSALENDHIVDVYDFDVIQGDMVIEMQFIDGVTLSKYLQSFPQRKVPLGTAAFIISRLLRGAAWMHSAEDERGNPLKLVHRDLKPPNIFLSKAGGIKIGDFGLAKGFGRQFETRDDQMRGTMRYMPPEQCLGVAIDGRADVHAIGIMFYEMLTGRKHPAKHHEVAGDAAAIAATLRSERVPVREYAPDAPEEVAAIVDRMVAFDASARPTAQEAMMSLASAVHIDIAHEELALQTRVSDIAHGRPVARVQVTRSAADDPTAVRSREPDSGVKTRDTPTARTAPVQVAASSGPTHPPAAQRRRWATWLLLAVSLGALVLGAAIFARTLKDMLSRDPASAPVKSAATAEKGSLNDDAPAAVATTAPNGPVSPPPAAQPAAPASPSTSLVKDRAPDGEPRVDRATLTVVAVPRGNVWIDGKLEGASPLTKRIAPGKHEIAVGAEAPEQTQTIQLKAGQRKRLEIEARRLFQ